jgi:tyrosine-protein kinase Etk/Wzc
MSEPRQSISSEPKPMEDDEISLLYLLQVVADHLRLLVLAPLAVGLVALGLSFLITPVFTARSLILPPAQQASAATALLANLGPLAGAAGAAAGLKNPGDQYVAFLKSASVQDALISRFKLVERFEVKFKDDARKQLAAVSRISAGMKDGTISIEVDDPDPRVAADLANAYVEELQRLTSRLALTEAQQRRRFFEAQLTQTRDKLTQAEQALKASGVNPGAIKANPAAAVSALAQLQAQITAQEIRLASYRGYLTEGAPEIRQGLVELAALREQLRRLEASSTDSGNGGGSDYVARYREFKYQETLFDLFSRQFELARVDESRETTGAQVIDAAQPPERKSKPKKAQIAMVATLASGFALLILVFLRHAFRSAAQQPDTQARLARLRGSLAAAIGRRARPAA